MDIEIYLGNFSFTLEIINIDDYFPAIEFRYGIIININNISEQSTYIGTCWVKCNDLDQFVKETSEVKFDSSLMNMDEDFLFRLQREMKSATLSIRVNKRLVDGRLFALEYESAIDIDLTRVIHNKFANIPKWW